MTPTVAYCSPNKFYVVKKKQRKSIKTKKRGIKMNSASSMVENVSSNWLTVPAFSAVVTGLAVAKGTSALYHGGRRV
jgi:hypothetical protein